MRGARRALATLALAVCLCAAAAETAWTASEILALCDGTDDGLPCEKLVDPRAYIPCNDARCHKPGELFRSPNACGRPRPKKNEVLALEWTEAALDRLRTKQGSKKATGVRNRAEKHVEL